MADEKYRLENHTAADLDEMLGKVGELYTKDELDELIAAKADQSALDELETEVNGKAAIEDLIPQTMALNDNVDDYKIADSLTDHSGVKRWICPSSSVRGSLTGLPTDFPNYPDFEIKFEQFKTGGIGMQTITGGSLTTVYQARRFYKNGSFSSWYKVAMEAVT